MTINTVPIKIGWEDPTEELLNRLRKTLNEILGSLWKITSHSLEGNYLYLRVECKLDKFDHGDKAYVTGLAAGFLAASGIEIL